MFKYIPLLAFAAACAAAAEAPRILREPVLGLRYDQARIKFEPLPPAVLASCSALADNPNIRSNWFIYAHAGSYYIAGGYSIRSRPRPPDFPEYEIDADGVAFQVERGLCTVFGSPREAIHRGEIADEPMRALLSDSARRLALAFGGEAQLRAELRRQRIGRLLPPLQDAIDAARRSTGCTAPCARR